MRKHARRLRSLAAALLALYLSVTAGAHEGQEHAGEAGPASPSLPASPRLALSSPPLELVAVREAGALVIWIDDYDSNTPLTGLNVQVREGSRMLQAQPAADGSYRLPADLFAADQPLALSFVVHATQGEQQLQGVLPAPVTVTAESSLPMRLLAATVALIALLALALLWRRRRRIAS
jgi:hypothetical protein